MAKNTYVLGKRIARGGMAEIYLGKAIGEAAFQRICAIKRILPHYSQDKEFIEMFRDEAHICKRLQHANIVQVYDFTEVENSYALIMEHVDGCDLRTLLSACEGARTRLTIAMSLYITANSARALHYAHTKTDEITKEPLGIVHRDISPQNILISYEGEVKITDFGIASAENKITETRPGVVKGKYSYMSPEQVAAKQLDGRSDIFSLAIVLWESLAMKRLFAGQTEVESIRRVQNCEISQDLRELNSQVDDELYSIVMRGLSKERRHRYQSAAAFEKDLLRYLHSKYADFTASELGNFLKRILAKKRGKTQDDIKETLSQLQVKPHRVASEAMETQNTTVDQKPLTLNRGGQINSAVSAQSVTGTHSRPVNPSQPGQEAVMHSVQRTNAAQQAVYRRADSRPAGSNRFMMFLLMILLVFGGYWFAKNFILVKKLQIKVVTKPDTVALSINGKRVNDGYTKTPAKLSLKPGQYTIEFNRPGYLRETLRVRGKAGDLKELPRVSLRKNPAEKLTQVRIIAPDEKIYVNVDNGLYRGPTPLRVALEANTKHSILFNANDAQKKVLKCSFRLPPNKDGRSLTVFIRRGKSNKGRCTIKAN